MPNEEEKHPEPDPDEGGKTPTPFTNTEEAMLVDKKHAVNLETALSLRLAILIISWISLFYLGCMGIAVLVLAILEKNTASFAFSLDAILDAASSIVVIWRYSGSMNNLYSTTRERIACITLGVLFLASFLSILIKSSISLATTSHPNRSEALFVLSCVNTGVCLALVISKSYIAAKLESISIATDSVNSGIGMVLAVAAIISDVVYANNPSIWFINATVGIGCSAFLLAYGIWLIVYEVRIVPSQASSRRDSPHEMSSVSQN